VVIKGESPNEASVTRFGQSMEFSSGMFTNLNIETQREVPKAVKGPGNTAAEAQDPSVPQPEVVAFTIKCNYARNGVQQQTANVATAVPASHTAKN
jgi:hypothetical protein